MTKPRRKMKPRTPARVRTTNKAKPRARSSTKRASNRISTTEAGHHATITVRMYNVGFGDCFLIIIPGEPTRSVLVDAGFHSQGKGKFSGAELAAQVIADVEQITGRARIDVVIATHRHQDHVTTFNSAAWDKLKIGEVWMPWVEDRDNPSAVKLWKKRQRFALALTDALDGFQLAATDKQDIAFKLGNAGVPYARLAKHAGWKPELPVAELSAWSNEGALDRLHSGFAQRDVDQPRFLPSSNTFPEAFTSKVLPDVRVHVLGPPRDPDLISEGNPEVDGESYRTLELIAADQANGNRPVRPFGKQWLVTPKIANRADKHRLKGKERKEMDRIARDIDPMFAASALDGIINATSLVLVLQIGSAKLLLPGDAEWGTWKQILKAPAAVALLKGTTFIKIGHHGSHNATPKSLVKKMLPTGVKAMISTQEGTGQYRNNIPLPALLSALDERKVSYARSDRPAQIPSEFRVDNEQRWIELEIPI